MKHLKLFLPMLACILALLVALICVPAQVHAQTRAVPYQGIATYQPFGIVTSLNRSIQPGNYYFNPTYITCRVYRPCFTVINRTGTTVFLINGYGRFVTRVLPGGSFSQTYYFPGTFTVTDWQRNVRVPLTITVGGFYPQSSYTEIVQPSQWTWQRF